MKLRTVPCMARENHTLLKSEQLVSKKVIKEKHDEILLQSRPCIAKEFPYSEFVLPVFKNFKL